MDEAAGKQYLAFWPGLVDAAEAERKAAPPRPASSSFAQRLEKSKGQKAEL